MPHEPCAGFEHSIETVTDAVGKDRFYKPRDEFLEILVRFINQVVEQINQIGSLNDLVSQCRILICAHVCEYPEHITSELDVLVLIFGSTYHNVIEHLEEIMLFRTHCSANIGVLTR